MTPSQPTATDELMAEMTKMIEEAAQRMTPWQFRVACWKLSWLVWRVRWRLRYFKVKHWIKGDLR